MKKIHLILSALILLSACKSKTPCDKFLDLYASNVDNYVNCVKNTNVNPNPSQADINLAFALEREVINLDFQVESFKSKCKIDSTRYFNLLLMMKTNFVKQNGASEFLTMVNMRQFITEFVIITDTNMLNKLFELTYKYSCSSQEPYLKLFQKAYKSIDPSSCLFNLLNINSLTSIKNNSDEEIIDVLGKELIARMGKATLILKKELAKLNLENITVEIYPNSTDRLIIKSPRLNEFIYRDIRKTIINLKMPLSLYMIAERDI